MQHRGRRDRHLRRHMRDLGVPLQEAEVIEHRVIVGEIELADHPHRIVPGFHAGELDARIGMIEFAAGQLGEEVEVPPGAAEFAVGGELQPDRRLLVHHLLDFHVLDLLEVVGADLALLEFGAGFLDLLRAQETADFVGAKRRPGPLHLVTPLPVVDCLRVVVLTLYRVASYRSGNAQKPFQRRGIGLQRGARRIVDDGSTLQDHGAVGQSEGFSGHSARR